MTVSSQLLRVLMVNTHASVGGAARMAATLARAIDASGKAVVSLYHCGDREKNPPLYGIRRFGSRQLNAVLARCGGSLAVQDFGVAQEIARRSETADIIHLHNLHGYYLDWDRLFRAIERRPFVWTWHDMWGATGRCGFSSACEGWRTGCKPCPHMNYYPAAWLDRAASEYRRKSQWLERLPRLLIATPSEWLRQIAIQRGIPPERLVWIPNPVDVSAYKPTPTARARERLGLSPDERYLLFVAADCNNPLKGYRDFLFAVQQTKWRGLVAGGAPSDLPSTVIYLGSFSDPESLSICYSAADALVVPSLFDNSPNTVIESMACGTPVFGFDAGGIASQMHPQWGGVVPTGDTEALSALLKTKLKSNSKSDAMVAELRDYAVSRWGPDHVVHEYIALYRRAMSST